MKIKVEDYSLILKKVEQALVDCCDVFGISFEVEEILLYGSQLTKKEFPNDIDVFVRVSLIEIIDNEKFLSSYGPTFKKISHDDLMEITYMWLHDNQPFYKEIPIDINFRDYEFDLDGEFISLKSR